MPYIRKVTVGEAEGPLAKIYEAATRRAGKVYEIVQVMSLAPRQLQASMRFYTELMKGEGPLEPSTREMLAVVVSRANDCHY